MFCFDIETLGIESTTVILSAGIIYFDPETDQDVEYDDLVSRGLFIKFDAKDQLLRLERTMTKSTLDWWNKQGSFQQQSSFMIRPEDLKAEEAFKAIHAYVNKHMRGKSWDKEFIWARGSLDQMAIDSLALKVGVDPIAPFSRWRDMRTAIDMLTGSTNGYCEVKGLDPNVVIKHHPVHDCAYDILMLIKGSPVADE